MTRTSTPSLPQPACLPMTVGVHGGPDAQGVPMYDFSTNSNACCPCPEVLAAVQRCDASRYPDPAYTDLRQQLADFHGVPAWRIVLAASASDFIYRITAWAAQQGGRTVRVPVHAYGDYAQAARAWGMDVCTNGHAALQWHADPSSPLGQSLADEDLPCAAAVQVLDCAYAPLRLSGTAVWSPEQRDKLWQLYSPNKALGMTGVRAALAIAPHDAAAQVEALNRLCPSWPVGAHGVAMLQAWCQPEVHAWLAQSLQTLRSWKARQMQMLTAVGWTCLPSEANFFCARPAGCPGIQAGTQAQEVDEWQRLRALGIKVRDTTSFDLPGHVRLGVQTPAAQDALIGALR